MEKDFNKYTLAELRRYARFLGITNSTSCNKDELIDKIIIALATKRKKPETKRGRPANQLKIPLAEENLNRAEVEAIVNNIIDERSQLLKTLFITLIDKHFNELKTLIIDSLFFH